MGYTVVPYVNPGDSWTAAQHNTYIRDNFAALWPFTAAGDITLAQSAYAITKLPIGAENTILVNVDNSVSWSNLDQIYCAVEVTSTSVSTASWTLLSYDNATKNPYDIYNGTYPTRLTSPFAGVYLLSGNIFWSSSSQQTREIKYYNSNTSKEIYIDTQPAALTNVNNISIPVYLPKGAYIEIAVYQGSGSSLDMSANITLTYWGS